jgi:threonine dehydrogenase-like Zn-dependent dehydrogenase
METAARPRREAGAERVAGADEVLAATITAPRRADLVRRPIRDPAPGELRVRVEGCGVCASNLPVWEGREWFDYPLAPGAPGHEGWGRVDAVGTGVTGVREGDRIAFLGGDAFATHAYPRGEEALVLPPALDGVPLPGEPLGCAMNILRRSGIEPGQRVAVVGVGFLGALLVGLASRAGAEVIAVARRVESRGLGLAMGAASAAPLDLEGVAESLGSPVEEALCDVVIEAAGAQRPLDLAAALVRERGRLVIAGFHQDGPRQVDMQTWNWRGIDVVNAHERDPREYLRGMREAVQAFEEGRFDHRPLLSHTFSLDGLDGALEMARTRPPGFIKAIVRP